MEWKLKKRLKTDRIKALVIVLFISLPVFSSICFQEEKNIEKDGSSDSEKIREKKMNGY